MDSLKRICVCATQIPFNRGGAEILAGNLVSHLQQRSYAVEQIQLPLQTSPLEEVVKGCLAWRMMNLERVANDRIDLVIGTKFPSYMVPHPRKVIWLVHQYRAAYNLFDSMYSDLQNTSRELQLRQYIIDLDQAAFYEAKRIFTISRTVTWRLKEYNGFESVPLYPPVDDADQFRFDGLEDFVLSVSRLEGDKRVHLLIEAMQFVSASFKAVIVGDGSLRAEHETLTRRLGLQDRILFAGAIPRAALLDYYSRAGAIFYGPFDEDYGYVTIEAFCSRKPVITCHDSGSTLEFVDPGTGWIAGPDPKSVAACIEDALSRKKEAKLRGEAGYEKIAYINWNYVLDHLLG